jgi:hypothetical protein
MKTDITVLRQPKYEYVKEELQQKTANLCHRNIKASGIAATRCF